MIKANRYTTLTATLAAGATSGTLTSAVFDDGTAVPLVIEYDTPSNIEVVTADISGTALTNISRGKDGTSDIAHTGTTKICQASTPQAWKYWIENDYSTSGKAWTTWTPTIGATAGTAPSYTTKAGYYVQIGKTVHYRLFLDNTSGGTAGSGAVLLTFTLPVAAAATHNTYHSIGHGSLFESGGTICPVTVIWAAGVGAFRNAVTSDNITAADQSSADRTITISGTYEAA